MHAKLKSITDLLKKQEELTVPELSGLKKDFTLVIDLESTILYADPEWPDVTGYSREETVGKTFFDFIEKEDYQRLRNFQDFILREDRPDDRTYDIVKIKRKLNNTTLFSDFAVDGRIVYDDEKKPVGMIVLIRFSGIAHEIHQIEHGSGTGNLSLVHTYRQALDHSAIVAFTDRAGRISYVNDFFCELSGYSREELIGQTHRILNSGNHPPEFFQEMWKTISTGNVWKGEICNRKKNGDLYWVYTTITPIQDENGKIVRYASVRSEITRRKLLEAQLREQVNVAEKANQAKSDFLAKISHELRTPLNGILGLTEILRETGLNTTQLDYLDILNESGRTLLVLINDILTLTRDERSELIIQEKPFSIRSLVKTVQTILTSMAQERHLTVHYNYMNDVPEIMTGDPVRLQQILMNVAGNAIKFSKENDSVYVRFSYDYKKSELVIETKDSGIGMTEEQIRHIYEPFYQAHRGNNRLTNGVGLGMSIVGTLVERLNGTIEVQSKPNAGSTFTIHLPLRIHEESSQKAKGLQKGVFRITGSQENHKVLIVEDNPVNQLVLKHLLQRLGYDTETAENGKVAVDLVTGQYSGYDFIFMDIQMPVMDGIEATKQIRSRLPQSDQPPIIGVTAHANDADRSACEAAGMDDYLAKPVEFDELEQVLKHYTKADVQ